MITENEWKFTFVLLVISLQKKKLLIKLIAINLIAEGNYYILTGVNWFHKFQKSLAIH